MLLCMLCANLPNWGLVVVCLLFLLLPAFTLPLYYRQDEKGKKSVLKILVAWQLKLPEALQRDLEYLFPILSQAVLCTVQ